MGRYDGIDEEAAEIPGLLETMEVSFFAPEELCLRFSYSACHNVLSLS